MVGVADARTVGFRLTRAREKLHLHSACTDGNPLTVSTSWLCARKKPVRYGQTSAGLWQCPEEHLSGDEAHAPIR